MKIPEILKGFFEKKEKNKVVINNNIVVNPDELLINMTIKNKEKLK